MMTDERKMPHGAVLVVLDANILYSDYLLRGAELVATLSEAKSLGYGVAIAHVTLLELARQYRSARNTASKALRKVDGDVVQDVEFSQAVETIQSRLEVAGVRVLPMTEPRHVELV